MPPSRRVVIAVALSVFLHVIIFTVLALLPQPAQVPLSPDEPIPADDKPLEVVFASMAPIAEPEPTPMPKLLEAPLTASLGAQAEKTQLDPARLKKADHAPEHPEFLAAHDSQETHSRRGTETAQATPPPEPEPTPPSMPRPTPLPSVTPPPAFRTALRHPTPVPAILPARPRSTPAPAAGSPQGDGNDDTTGVAAIGAWKKAVGNAIGSCWNFYRQSRLDLLAVGSVRIKFAIDAQGHASGVRVLSNTATPTNALYAARSIKEAEIPPIPPERLARLPGGRVEVEFTFTIFPTR